MTLISGSLLGTLGYAVRTGVQNFVIIEEDLLFRGPLHALPLPHVPGRDAPGHHGDATRPPHAHPQTPPVNIP